MAHIIQTATACACEPVRQGLWTRIRRMVSLGKQRRALADLDDHLLRDVGLTRDQAMQEASRRPWDVPPHWQK